MKRCFGVVGGDRRQAELARLLAADGHQVLTYGLGTWRAEGSVSLEEALGAEVVLLPLPLCREEGRLNSEEGAVPTAELFCLLRPEQRVLAGQVRPQQLREACSHGLRVEDYFLREDLMVANAAATAEAAIQVAMERLDRSLLGMDCLVLGYGRIGKLLSHRLRGMGARVTATARSPEDLAWIRAYGFRGLRTSELDGCLESFGVVFNTVPAPVLKETLLAELPEDCLCVELASQPGIDLAAAERLGRPCVWARSLPGRLLPGTAAEAIRDAVYYILMEG